VCFGVPTAVNQTDSWVRFPVNPQKNEKPPSEQPFDENKNGSQLGCLASYLFYWLFGSSGRTRIINLTYFQQHAGQRMTS
jgi:hypothetical protein